MALVKFLSSLKLTLFLLLGLSAVAVFGTLAPGEQGRYDLFYQSFWFRLLLGFLALNLSVCTVKTILRNLRDRGAFLERLGTEQVFASNPRYVLPRGFDLDKAEKRLAGLGYRVEREGEKILGRRGLAGRWGSTIVHVSFLAIMIGALLGEAGFVGTLNIYIGDKSSVYFDWDRQRDMPLGFEFRLDHFEPLYYPIELRLAALDPQSGRELKTYQTREGELLDLPVPGLEGRILRFDPREQVLAIGMLKNGVPIGDYVVTRGRESFGEQQHPGVQLRPLAYKDPILKQLHSEVSILENGQVVRQGAIRINHPLVHDGVAIYQTAYDKDRFGSWFAGFQFSRDPGESIVWAGCIVMLLGLLLAFAVNHRAVGITIVDDEVLLVALSGFRAEGGMQDFDRLERELNRPSA